jgi:hypothetical protein
MTDDGRRDAVVLPEAEADDLPPAQARTFAGIVRPMRFTLAVVATMLVLGVAPTS